MKVMLTVLIYIHFCCFCDVVFCAGFFSCRFVNTQKALMIVTCKVMHARTILPKL